MCLCIDDMNTSIHDVYHYMARLSKMQLLDLPAELVIVIVEQVVRVLGLERALIEIYQQSASIGRVSHTTL